MLQERQRARHGRFDLSLAWREISKGLACRSAETRLRGFLFSRWTAESQRFRRSSAQLAAGCVSVAMRPSSLPPYQSTSWAGFCPFLTACVAIPPVLVSPHRAGSFGLYLPTFSLGLLVGL